MILKRLLAVALGALGLGALASGPAFGQAPGSSNIPAPDVFDDQITCTQLLPNLMGNMGYYLPSRVPKNAEMSPLDDIIGMGMNTLDDTALASVTDGPAKLAGLGYVIPPGNMNCGAGTTGPMLGDMNIDADTNGSFLDAGDTIAWGSIPKDVADGYSDLLTKYVAVYGDPGGTAGGTLRALEAAQKLVDDTDANLEALLEARVRARNAAQETHNKALAAFNAASGGPIYQAGVTEWKAKAAVSQAIADYNEQVGKTNTARTALNNMQYSEWNVADAAGNFAVTQGASKYVPLGMASSSLLGTGAVVTITNGMASINSDALVAYTGGTESARVNGMAAMAATGVGTADAMAATPSDTTTSNFTALGELIVPMTAVDLDNDGASFLEALVPTVSANGDGTNDVETIRMTVMNTRIAAAALKKERDENTNPRFQTLYDEAYRRAMLEQNYYDAVWAQVLADNTDTRNAQQRLQYVDTNTNGINEVGEQTTANLNNASNSSAVAANYYVANPVTIASRNAAYSTESGKRMAEETSLRGLVAAREMATAGVAAQFTNAQSFYQQLVDRRQALKTAADKVVADTTNPSAAQTKAAADAAKALMTAQDEKAKIDALFPAEADNPVVGLVSELLKTGGDDGQALVDAISNTYEDTQTNRDDIATLKGQLTDAAGNPIDLTNLGDSEAVMQNTSDIETLDGRVTENEGEIDQINEYLLGPTSSQHAVACEGASGLLAIANCVDARSRHNEEDIADLGGDIEGLEGRVGDNEDKLKQKAEYIGNLGKAIGIDAATGDGMVELADGTMGSRIDKNAEDIVAGDNAVRGEFAAADDVVRSEFAAADDVVRSEFEAADGVVRSEFAAADAALAGEGRTTETIKGNADAIAINSDDIMTNARNIADESTTRMQADMGHDAALEEGARLIRANTGMIGDNAADIGSNRSNIMRNADMIGGLQDQMEVVRAGVAASMALAGMPAVNGRGIAIGVGSYDGESAFAVGFQIQGEQASFKIGVTSSGGETGASAGVGFNF